MNTSLGNYHRDTTPFLKRIASESGTHSFHKCITHGKWTGTSSASMLTGTTPPTHGIYGASDRILSEEVATIPELLPGAYSTVSLVSNPNAGPAKGLDRGFDESKFIRPSTLIKNVDFTTLIKSPFKLWQHGGGLTADIRRHEGLSSYMITDMSKNIISGNNDPYFLYVHPNSSHLPYLPPPEFADQFLNDISYSLDDALDLVQSAYGDIYRLNAEGLSNEEWSVVEAMYDAVICHVDYCVEQIVSSIRSQGDNTIVVVTADHGDLLGEYGLAGHKFVTHDALTHVPLVVSGLNRIGDKTEQIVQHIDIWKTIFAQIDADNDQLEGTDLTRGNRKYAISQRSGENCRKNLQKVQKYNENFNPSIVQPQLLTSVRSKDKKLLYTEDDVRMFALPNETTDMKHQYQKEYNRMISFVEKWIENHEIRPAAKRNGELESHIQEHLSDMGYLTDI
jgi:uncharacterized sulfatase